MTSAYPLYWPLGFPRTKLPSSSRFSTHISQAVRNVMDELRRFGNDSGRKVEGIIVSSNVSLTEHKPNDPGVAVYFRWDGIDCCIAVDRYKKPQDNLQAIARVVDAERTKLRHGGLNIARTSFRGFASLPPPKDVHGRIEKPWWGVMGFQTTPPLEAAEARYRELVKKAHPDRGGDPALFNTYTEAIRKAREELS